MSLLVVGSVAYDAVETPFGKREKAYGGSAAYFSMAASFFTDVNMVAIIGEDYEKSEIKNFNDKGIDTEGLKRVKGDTFFWKGKYSDNLNEAHTIETKLNVFQDFNPELPEEYKSSKYVFLANIDPVLQLKVLKQVKQPRIIAMDTMNYWIQGKKNELMETLKHVDILFINSTEAKLLTNKTNHVSAAKEILKYGPRAVIIKLGEFGAILFNGLSFGFTPAYPVEYVIDPTGAGDSFAGGFMGFLASNDDLSESALKEALIFGTVTASFDVEDFSYDRFKQISEEDIERRAEELFNLMSIE